MESTSDEVMRLPIEATPLGLGGVLDGAHFDITEEDLEEASAVSFFGEEPDGIWDITTAELMRYSCAFFAQEILTGPTEPPYNGRFMVAEHHEEWDELVTSHKRLCILAARDHSKTFFFDFAYPIWKSYYRPRGKGFIFSATAAQAERILADIIIEIESNQKLQWLIPKKKEVWNKRQIRLSNGHTIYARGFGTKVRGAHPDWVVVDDGLNDESLYSEVVRKKQIDYFFTAITNMVVPGGQIIVVGTPFHQADLYAELEKNTAYTFRKYPALSSGVALWPDRYSIEQLEAKRKEIGSIRFNRDFQCSPVGDEMSLFPSYLFRGPVVEQHTVKLGMPLKWWIENVGIQMVSIGGDFAMSASVGADYSVFWVMGLDKFKNRWIMDIVRGQGWSFRQQLSMLKELHIKYDPGLVYLEANQMQRIFGDELIVTTDMPVRKFVTGVQKHSLDKGVPSLRVLLENEKVRIPRGDIHSIELTDIWIAEMQAFTYHDGELQSVAEHDDTVMGFWICDQACRLGGFTYSFGTDDDTLDHDEIVAELTGEVTLAAREAERENGASGDLIDEEFIVPLVGLI